MKIANFRRTNAAPAQVPLPPKKPAPSEPLQVAEIEPSPEPAAEPSSSGDKAGAATNTAPAAPKPTEVADHRALKIEIESGDGDVTGSLPKSGASSRSLWPDASMVFTLTLALLFALSATLFLGRRRMPTLPRPVAKLRGPTRLPSFGPTSVSARESAEAHQQGEAPASRLRLWDEDWLPGTMSEALDVLGVDPQASGDRIKSTVTRLRRALHPDYALDEEDRRLRERRLKQINVAWDIISGKRRSLWLSVKSRSA
jgi:hypothetical protein